MSYALALAITVFLALTAVAAPGRILACRRDGAHGRPDLESGHIRDLRPAEGLLPTGQPLLLGQGDAPGSQARTETRLATRGPVFSLGATPVPKGLSPWPSDEFIRTEFDFDTPDHRGRAA